jgi:hypothetical protein
LASNFYGAMAMAEHFGFRQGRQPEDFWTPLTVPGGRYVVGRRVSPSRADSSNGHDWGDAVQGENEMLATIGRGL